MHSQQSITAVISYAAVDLCPSLQTHPNSLTLPTLNNTQSNTHTHTKALLSKRDQPSRLQGLAHALLSKVYAVGHSQVQPAMLTQISDVVGVMREDPENFTRVNKGNGRQLVASKMQPGDYVLM